MTVDELVWVESDPTSRSDTCEVKCLVHGSVLVAPDMGSAAGAVCDHQNEHGIFSDEEGELYYDADEDQYDTEELR